MYILAKLVFKSYMPKQLEKGMWFTRYHKKAIYGKVYDYMTIYELKDVPRDMDSYISINGAPVLPYIIQPMRNADDVEEILVHPEHIGWWEYDGGTQVDDDGNWIPNIMLEDLSPGYINDWLYDYPNAIGPVKEIGESSAGVGMLLTAPELDGVTRRLPLIIQVKKETYPALPLEVLRVFGGEQSYQAKVNEAGLQAVRVKGNPPINTDANGRVWINFKYNFDVISYTDKDWSKVKGKIVVIALTAEGLGNTVATPVGISQGYEVSMQTLQMLVDGKRIERKAEFDLYELGAGILLGLLLVLSAGYMGYLVNGVLIVALLCAPSITGFYLFSHYGFLIDYTWPILAILLPWTGAIFFRFVMEFKLKQQIKKQFGTYLAPALVEKLQKNPGLLKLGGDERELSIMFTDVRGFTGISEHYGKNVQGLTMIMNRYMTAMTQAILDNDGTLDKYIGDAIMALFPDQEKNADHAVQAAIKIFELGSKIHCKKQKILATKVLAQPRPQTFIEKFLLSIPLIAIS